MADQFAATRNANKITLYLSSTRPAPVSVPIEIREEITADVWAGRLAEITQVASRYYKPMFERVWALVAVLAIIIAPVLLFRVILSALHFGDDPSVGHVYEARAISFAIFVGLVIFFVAPIAVWKYIGQMQVNALLLKWRKADATGRGSIPMSTWKVKTPGLVRSNIVLTIQLPPGVAVSSFHVNAYLPSYINPPVDADANYFYPYKAEPGLPRMSVVGNVPLFTDEKRGYYGTEKV
ncbi:Arginine methyl transferase [Mycena sanguinolenta]|uniref:Arginine methyl transferase n=1 Tax=Mycena sanguinolenta TaxID=230812 RepID=A0A8H7DJ52_9AGAR|nr:Arginine methyl transferase [Mycena sanguinolenta]